MDNFWKKVKKSSHLNCWTWLGSTNTTGFKYGRFRINGKLTTAHRAAWILCNGPVSKDIFVCHSCDNPSCVNPSHLFLGTRSDNVRDCVKKGRHASSKRTHCPKGHEYLGENLYLNNGRRVCKECNRYAALKYKYKNNLTKNPRKVI
jgi:hypothetical protein